MTVAAYYCLLDCWTSIFCHSSNAAEIIKAKMWLSTANRWRDKDVTFICKKFRQATSCSKARQFKKQLNLNSSTSIFQTRNLQHTTFCNSRLTYLIHSLFFLTLRALNSKACLNLNKCKGLILPCFFPFKSKIFVE